jgi:hypothetical protein
MTTVEQPNQKRKQQQYDEDAFPPIHAHIHQEDLLKEAMQKKTTSAILRRAVQRTSTVLAVLSPRRQPTPRKEVNLSVESGMDIFMPDLGSSDEFNLELMT